MHPNQKSEAKIINFADAVARKDGHDPDTDPKPPTSPKGGRGKKVKLDRTSCFQARGHSLAA